MVRRRTCAVSNHEATELAAILREARKSALLRMRSEIYSQTLRMSLEIGNMSASKKPDAPPLAVEARCVRLPAKAADAASLAPVVERRPLSRAANEVLIEIKAAAVNPSDVKAATGLMPYAVFPRTPGRDFSGMVVDGPREWMGKAVFGTSGDLGIRRDGTHASHLIVEAAALVEKPSAISMDEAAGIGVPFVTAIE